MNILFSNFSTANVIITKHVQQRIKERFRLYLTLTEQQNIYQFILKDFKTSKLNMNRILTPFYTNKDDSRYGKNSFCSQSEYINYYGRYDEQAKAIIIRTAVVKHRDINTR